MGKRIYHYQTKKKITLVNVASAETLRALKNMLLDVRYESEEQKELFDEWMNGITNEPENPGKPKEGDSSSLRKYNYYLNSTYLHRKL